MKERQQRVAKETERKQILSTFLDDFVVNMKCISPKCTYNNCSFLVTFETDEYPNKNYDYNLSCYKKFYHPRSNCFYNQHCKAN